MPDYDKEDKNGFYSLTDLIEHGHYAYNDFNDLPYEARQALFGYANDFTFEHMPVYSRFLPYNYPFLF